MLKRITSYFLEEVTTTGKTLVFIKENFLFSARLMEGRYFDADQLLSRVQGAFTVLTDAEKLRQTVMSVNAVSGRQTRFCLAFQGNTLRVTYEPKSCTICTQINHSVVTPSLMR